MIRFATPSDLPEIRALWDVCFPDDSGFNPYYFSHLFCPDNTLLYMENGRLAAMTQMLPYHLRQGEKPVPVTYIYGACTHPDFRRRHLMSQLLTASFDIDRQQGIAASILIPQEEWLFDFYAPFGYVPDFFAQTQSVCVQPQTHAGLRALCTDDLVACDVLYTAQTANYAITVTRTPMQWQQQLDLFDALGLGAFAWAPDGIFQGYAFVWRESTGLWAQELLCRDPRQEQIFCRALAAHAGCSSLRLTAPGENEKPLGCIKYYEPQPSLHGYMNLMLN